MTLGREHRKPPQQQPESQRTTWHQHCIRLISDGWFEDGERNAENSKRYSSGREHLGISITYGQISDGCFEACERNGKNNKCRMQHATANQITRGHATRVVKATRLGRKRNLMAILGLSSSSLYGQVNIIFHISGLRNVSYGSLSLLPCVRPKL